MARACREECVARMSPRMQVPLTRRMRLHLNEGNGAGKAGERTGGGVERGVVFEGGVVGERIFESSAHAGIWLDSDGCSHNAHCSGAVLS